MPGVHLAVFALHGYHGKRYSLFCFTLWPLFMRQLYFGNGLVLDLLAGLSIILALVTLFTTSMIYASLKTIRQWNTPMVPALFMAYALISGGCCFWL